MKLRQARCALASAILIGSASIALAPAAQAQTSPVGPAATGTLSTAQENSISATAVPPPTQNVPVSGATGAAFTYGNSSINIPGGAISGNATVKLTYHSPGFQLRGFAQVNFGGPGQSSPNGTNFDMTITDNASGSLITSFALPISIVTKPNAADLSFANGDITQMTYVYVVDATTPAPANPNGFPIGTRVVVPNIARDVTNGAIGTNLQFIGSVIAVSTNPVGYVQTLNDGAGVYSSFDPAASQQFGAKPQFSYLQVVEPQIGTRLAVIDPDTGNYSYVNAADVAPSGPPPTKTSGAVTRAELQ